MSSWISIEEVMALLGTSNANARQLASRRKWKTLLISGRAYYWLHDVLDTPRRVGR